MKMFRKKTINFILMFLVFVACTIYVSAAGAKVIFGSSNYNAKTGENFPIGIYIFADQSIGEYHIEAWYDKTKLQYISGATSSNVSDGTIIIDGTGSGTQTKVLVSFKALTAGDFSIKVTSAWVKDSQGNEYDITNLGSAPIHIDGENASTEEADNKKLEEDARQHANALALTNANENKELREEADLIDENGESEIVDTISNDAIHEENVSDSNNQEDELSKSGNTSIPKPSYESSVKNRKHSFIYNSIFLFVLAFIIFVVIVDFIIWRIIKFRRKRKKAKQKRHKHTEKKEETIDYEKLSLEMDMTMEMMVREDILSYELGEPVIKVCGVTMEFRLASENTLSIKEYLIKLIKRQITYKKLFALHDVSFNVYKGEIVGIIGTNGSGKSTLLKIISGALVPTEGHVEVDRSKIQLLTLGTGFDYELTAKENVFLNGSIIGYSRQFLERHYDEIVKFAELEEFMDQKVKNFSSGMVSRLGFAIATAGKAAEILILDEVLSVGDEFFRKKSLARIREMIHGGSTVLLVSHGMDTILNNCTVCVWIEKGEMKMIGEPENVCQAYRESKDLEFIE